MRYNKPRQSRSFKQGDMFIFSEGSQSVEYGLLIRRFDMYAKEGKPCEYPSWCWEIAFNPGNRRPWLYNDKHGASEVNLYNCIGEELRWIPGKSSR